MENGAQACQTGVTVLVVDDETMVRWAAADIFAELGFEVLEASDGVEALAILRERADVDLLFSDCRMPRMGGPELAAAAAALRPKLRIVLTTGYCEPRPRGWPLVPKPYSVADLRRAVA